MHYFRNFELAKQFHVSQTAVGKWIEAAKNGKLDLELIEDGSKSYIAATSKNRAVIEGVVESRKKYFNTKSHKVVKPKDEFYHCYMPEQILDIITGLEVRGEAPLQYSFISGGASNWDDYQQSLLQDKSPDSAIQIARLQLAMNRSYLDNILAKYERISIIDIGPGNGYPVKDYITYALELGKLNKYLAIDISPEMLAITERNIQNWFAGRAKIEADIRDFTHERFAEMLVEDSSYKGMGSSMNLILMLGGTLGNFEHPTEVIKTIYYSMNKNDVLIYTLKLDTGDNRKVFSSSKVKTIYSAYRFLVDALNIDENLYEVEMGYDEKNKERYIRIRLKTALTISFNLPQGERTVEFKKDETILVWRYRHQTAEEIMQQFTNSGFSILHSSQTPDHEFMLLICDLKTNRHR